MVGFVFSPSVVNRGSRIRDVDGLNGGLRIARSPDTNGLNRTGVVVAAASSSTSTLKVENKKKIAIIVEPTPFTHVSGYSNRFKTHIEHLKATGDEVLIICPDNSKDAPTEYMGAKVVNIPGFRFPLYKKILLSFGIRGVYPALAKFDPDVIHLSTPGFLTFAVLFVARLMRKPLLFSYHTHLPHYAKSYGMWYAVALAWWLIKVCHNRADATLATSPQLCNELREHGVERVGLWPKGVDTKIFDPKYKSHEMRYRLTNGNPLDKLVVYVGRLGAEKNLQSLKEVMSKMPKGTRLALVGDGPYKETLEQTLDSSTTYFAGLLRGEELSSAFASADVFVMPSESETLGFVVMESMASGVPVVGARAGGIPDLIHHEENGYLYEPGNTDQCASYLKTLLNNESLRKAMSVASREEALRWSWKTATATTRNVHYTRAISSFRFRALWGLGLPRSLSWFRWMRRRIVLLWILLTHQVRSAMQY